MSEVDEKFLQCKYAAIQLHALVADLHDLSPDVAQAFFLQDHRTGARVEFSSGTGRFRGTPLPPHPAASSKSIRSSANPEKGGK